MMYQDHVATSIALAASVQLLFAQPFQLVVTSPFSIVGSTVYLIGVGIGALLPDIDSPTSFISKVLPFPFYKMFNHRGITHSWLGFLLFAFCSMFLIHLFIPIEIVRILCNGLAVGYLLHMLEDSWSRSGILWLSPFSNYDSYIYQKYGHIVRPPVRYGKTRHGNKYPIRHWWGRGYVVDSKGTGERFLVGTSYVLLGLSILHTFL